MIVRAQTSIPSHERMRSWQVELNDGKLCSRLHRGQIDCGQTILRAVIALYHLAHACSNRMSDRFMTGNR